MKQNIVSKKNLNAIIDCYNKNIELGRYGFAEAIEMISNYTEGAEKITNKQRPDIIDKLQGFLTYGMKNSINQISNNPKYMWGSNGKTLVELAAQ